MREVSPFDDADRLRLAVRDELAVQYAIGQRDLSTEQWLDSLAEMVSARIDYGFDIRWNPDWVENGAPHTWTEQGEHFVECLKCQRTTAHSTHEDADAWYRAHLAAHHE